MRGRIVDEYFQLDRDLSTHSRLCRLAERVPDASECSPQTRERQIAAFIYALSGELEQRTDELGARWAISPDPTSSRVVLELVAASQGAAADEFLALLIADHILA